MRRGRERGGREIKREREKEKKKREREREEKEQCDTVLRSENKFIQDR
jgi:hypothetical protein